MNAHALAGLLHRAGMPVMSVREGNDELDGQIMVTPLIYVHVPYRSEGGWPCIVQIAHDGLRVFPERHLPELMLWDYQSIIRNIT